jgi:hypothetical protein
MRETTSYTIGVAGAGKSYARCARFLHDEFLPLERGVHWSNFPVDVDALAESLDGKHSLTADVVRERVRVIPDETLKLWREGQSGPWDFFRDVDIQGAHIAIDEAHTVIGAKHPKDHKHKWQVFLGELRHRGATIELLTQAEAKLAQEVKDEAGAKLVIINSESRRDPIFRVQLGDWYQLRAKFLTGEYRVAVWQREYRNVGGKSMTVEDERHWPRDPYYFRFYDSYSAPTAGGLKAEAQRKEWELKSKGQLVAWFLRRNWVHIAPRLAVAAVAFWVCFLGGGTFLISKLQTAVVHAAVKQTAVDGSGVAESESVPPGRTDISTLETRTVPVIADVGEEERAHVQGAARQVAELQKRVEWLELEKRDRETIVRQAQGVVNQLREAVERGYWLVGILGGDTAVFRDGLRLKVGQVIPSGRYEGRRVVAVDGVAGTVTLQDGLVFRLGERTTDDFERLQKLWADTGAAGVLAEAASQPADDGEGTPGGGGEWQTVRQRQRGTAVDDSSGGPAVDGLPAPGGDGNGDQRGGVGPTPVEAGDGGPERPAD